MSFLVIAREPYALPIGESTIGGSGDDALPVPGVSATSPLAELQAMPDGSATIRRLGGDVRVNGTAIGAEPVALRHGMRLEVGGVGMLYGDMAARGSTAHVAGVSDDDLALLADLSPVEPTAPTGGRLVAAESGTTHDIPDGGIEIGRDPACGLALTSKDVSRLHADIRPGLRGYVLTDRSVNGTFVNGARVADPRVLGNGDVIRVGREEFRFFADAATYAEPSAGTPVARDGGTPRVSVPPGTVMPGSTGSTLFATLEIVNTGPLQGTRFRIERPVAHVGRGAHNDVRLKDDSVSGAHATLTRRATGWVVLDLGSTNGTYVDGERVAAERRLEHGCELRFGNVKLVFRAMQGADRDEASTRALVGVPEGPMNGSR